MTPSFDTPTRASRTLLWYSACFGNDMCMPGSWTACMDLGGRFAGTLSGFMNMMGMVGGLLAPYTSPIILDSAGGNWDVPSW